MGNIWTRASLDRLSDIQDRWVSECENSVRQQGKLVRFHQRRTTVLDDENKELHMYSLECRSDDEIDTSRPVIFLHGYGAGSLLFSETMANLAHVLKRPVIAVDWVGTGASERATFTPKSSEETISFFNGYFDKWVVSNNIAEFDLVGHSMGGYFASHYAMNFGKEKVKKLVLASPVGVPEPPSNFDLTKAPWWVRTIASWWDRGVTPGHLIRFVGPFGKPLVRKAAKARFEGDETLGLQFLQEDPKKSHWAAKYLHQITACESNGEHALSKVLMPFAFARNPLLHDFHKIDNVEGVLFLYGDRDWMNPQGGYDAQKIAKVKTEVKIVPGTHHLYLHDSRKFDHVVSTFLSKPTLMVS